ncbi:MAG: Gfo/Idh/MocA family oxidoreductase [Actinobacteria bacterium]|nr:MAG: Gfo/Idh/MocA family oxidoreductase [Actinomycetota bacterium]
MEYHPGIRAIKSYIKQGEIGEILYIYSQRLNLGKVRSDENCLWSLGPHDISVILSLIGKEPKSVVATGQSYLQKEIEDVVFLTMSFPNKIMANVHISWLDPHKVRKFTIAGSKKMVVFDDMQSMEKIKVYDKGIGPPNNYRSYGRDLHLRFGDISIPHIKMSEPLRIECLHFLDCIKNNKTPISSGEEGLKVVKILEAAQESMNREGILVNV